MKYIELETCKIPENECLTGRFTKKDGTLLFLGKTQFSRSLLNSMLGDNIDLVYYYPQTKKEMDTFALEEENIEKLIYNYQTGAISQNTVRNSINYLRRVTFQFLKGQESIDFFSCRFAIKEIYNEIRKNPSALVNMLDIKFHDSYTYSHSVNVGIISINLAIKMNFSEEDVQLVGMGGFLHDIGKIAVPAALINKTSVLTEEEKRIMKSHPTHSKRIMGTDPNIHPKIVSMAYEHHERYDGKGYPRGISGDTLDVFSVIVGLADVYDALTTVRSYKPAFSPEEAVQLIETYTGTHFAPRIAEKFIRDIQKSIQKKSMISRGNLVLLNTGEIAEVLHYVDQAGGADIVVKIMLNSKGEREKENICFNIKDQTERKIERGLKRNEEVEKLSLA